MHEALSHLGWKHAVEEMVALHSISTWDLVTLPTGKSLVSCRWVYTVKIGQDGWVDRLKARLLPRGILRYMTQITISLFLLLSR